MYTSSFIHFKVA
ncbi:hypothetical protein D046_5815A, partial [Vibrio parahaemolyticus V-223/04]